ncbi:hypothetical protein [Oceanobacillus rekensis]|uniref:hypothetical protein n=1 Tax=Oceanobacillus rekensis TaxID=937927 RepID=UPI000B44A3C1|nr:hypothetical protein [Oceanobacillus rekensis]
MVKNCLFLLGALLFAVTSLQSVQAEPASNIEDDYVTTEDIIEDIVFPTIDKKVIEKYGSEDAFGWQLSRIVGIDYNNNHSYDLSMQIKIDIKDNPHKFTEDLVKVRIYPSCDSEKIECDHGFKIEMLDYKQLTQ